MERQPMPTVCRPPSPCQGLDGPLPLSKPSRGCFTPFARPYSSRGTQFSSPTVKHLPTRWPSSVRLTGVSPSCPWNTQPSLPSPLRLPLLPQTRASSRSEGFEGRLRTLRCGFIGCGLQAGGRGARTATLLGAFEVRQLSSALCLSHSSSRRLVNSAEGQFVLFLRSSPLHASVSLPGEAAPPEQAVQTASRLGPRHGSR